MVDDGGSGAKSDPPQGPTTLSRIQLGSSFIDAFLDNQADFQRLFTQIARENGAADGDPVPTDKLFAGLEEHAGILGYDPASPAAVRRELASAAVESRMGVFPVKDNTVRPLLSEEEHPDSLPGSFTYDTLHGMLSTLSSRLCMLRRALLSQTLTARRAHLKEIFNSMDADADGNVSRGELYAHMRGSRELRGLAGEAMREMSDLEVFRALDKDHDGVVTWAEFEAQISGMMGPVEGDVAVRDVPAASSSLSSSSSSGKKGSDAAAGKTDAGGAKAAKSSTAKSGTSSATSKLSAKERKELKEKEARAAEEAANAELRARAKGAAIDKSMKRTEQFKRLFQDLDTNGDGVVSTLEFVRGVKHDPELLRLFTDGKSLDREVQVFNTIDADKSGSLCWDEFLAACEQLDKLRRIGAEGRVAFLSDRFLERRSKFKEVFDAVDVNKDNSVSIIEFGHAIDNHPALREVMNKQSVAALAKSDVGLFDIIDRDGDGRISWEEFDAALSVLSPQPKVTVPKGAGKDQAAGGGSKTAGKTARPGATARKPAAKMSAAERKKRKKKGDMDDMNEYERAALTIMNADMMLLVVGSGFARDSGIPLYPEIGRMPQYRALGMNAADLTNPDLVENQPNLSYGFWGHMYNTCRENPPHQGYDIANFWKEKLFTGPEAAKRIKPENLDEAIKALKLRRTDDTGGPPKRKQKRPPAYKLPFYCVTTCWDGHLYKSGFDPREVSDIHGCITGWQCSKKCKPDVWSLGDEFIFEIDTSRMWAPLFKTLGVDEMRDIAIREEEEDRAAAEAQRARGGIGGDCGCSEHARLHALPYKPPRLTQLEVSKYRPDNHLWISPEDDEYRALTAERRRRWATSGNDGGLNDGDGDGSSSNYNSNHGGQGEGSYVQHQHQHQQQERRPRSAATPEIMLDALSADFDASVRFSARQTPRGDHDHIEDARDNPKKLHHMPTAPFTDHRGRPQSDNSARGSVGSRLHSVRGNANPPSPANAHFSGTFAFRDGDYYMRREDVRRLHEETGVEPGTVFGDGGDNDFDDDVDDGDGLGGTDGASGNNNNSGNANNSNNNNANDANGSSATGGQPKTAAKSLDPELRDTIAQRMGYVPKSVTLLEGSLARQAQREEDKAALDRAARENEALSKDDDARRTRRAAQARARGLGGGPNGSGPNGANGGHSAACRERYAQLPPHDPGCLYYPPSHFSSYLNPGALSRSRATRLDAPPVTPDPERNQPRCINNACKAPAVPNIKVRPPGDDDPVFVPRKTDRSYRKWISNVKQIFKTDETKKVVIVEVGVGLGAGAGGMLRKVGEDLLGLDPERVAMVRINPEFHLVTGKEEQSVCIKDTALNAFQRIHEYVEAEMDTIQTAVQPYYDKMAKMASKGRR